MSRNGCNFWWRMHDRPSGSPLDKQRKRRHYCTHSYVGSIGGRTNTYACKLTVRRYFFKGCWITVQLLSRLQSRHVIMRFLATTRHTRGQDPLNKKTLQGDFAFGFSIFTSFFLHIQQKKKPDSLNIWINVLAKSPLFYASTQKQKSLTTLFTTLKSL